MKIQGIVFALAFAVNLMNASETSGQFKDAAVADVAVGVSPVFANNTGNCIYETGGVTYIVNVWDDANNNNANFSWQVGAASGFVSIDPAALVVDPDICIVKNTAGTIYAVVVYFDQNSNQFMMRYFNWQPGLQQFSGNIPVLLSPGQFANSINIDANDVGDFAIVWDQAGQQIQLAIGITPGSNVPQLVFPGGPFNLDSGEMPDVCFYRNGTTNDKQVDVVFKSPSNIIAVDGYRFSDLIGGIIAVQPMYRSGLPDLVYRNPRIDCPPPSYGSPTSFTVVVEDSDNLSSWYIKSFNSNDCCPGFTTTVYNDGSSGNSPYNLTDIPNTKPVVAYYNTPDGVIIGWNFDNSFGLLGAPGASVARYPVVMSCDKKAQIHSGSSYLNVPTGTTNGWQVGKLSVSGKHSTKGLYTYLNSVSNDIYFKSVPHVGNAVSLRIDNSGNFQGWLNEMLMSHMDETLEFYAYDILGKQVFQFSGTPDNLHSEWQAFTDAAVPGIYTVRSISNSGNTNYTGKLFIGN